MKQSMRFAVTLQHKNQSWCDNANTLLYGDYDAKQKRYIYVRTGDHELVDMGDYRMGTVLGLLNKLIQVDTSRKDEFEPCILYKIQKNEQGEAEISKEGVLEQHWQEFQENQEKFRPYLQQVKKDGLVYTVLPYVDSNSVFTMVTLDSSSPKRSTLEEQIQEFSEKVMVHFATGYEVWRICWDTVHSYWNHQHNRDINQDDMLLQLGTTIQRQTIVSKLTREWLPTLEVLQKRSSVVIVDLQNFNTQYLYKYKLENTDPAGEPVFFAHILDVTPGGEAPLGQAELIVSKEGNVLDGVIHRHTKSNKHVYETEIQTQHQDYERAWTNTSSIPLNTPWVYTTEFMGDKGTLYQEIKGHFECHPHSRVQTTPEQYRKGATISCTVECYSVDSDTKIKEIPMMFGTSEHSVTSTVMSFHDTHTKTIYMSAILGYTPEEFYRMKLRWVIYWGRVTDTEAKKIITTTYNPTQYGQFRFDAEPIVHQENIVYAGVKVTKGISGINIAEKLYLPGTTTEAFSRFTDFLPSQPSNVYTIPTHQDDTEVEWWGFTHNEHENTGFPVIQTLKMHPVYKVKRIIEETVPQPNPYIVPVNKIGEGTILLAGGRKFQIRSSVPYLRTFNYGTVDSSSTSIPTEKLRIHGTQWINSQELHLRYKQKEYQWTTLGTIGTNSFQLALVTTTGETVAEYDLHTTDPGQGFPLTIQQKKYWVKTTPDKPSGIYVEITTCATARTRYLLPN